MISDQNYGILQMQRICLRYVSFRISLQGDGKYYGECLPDYIVSLREIECVD